MPIKDHFRDSAVSLSISIMLLAAGFFGLSSFTCAIFHLGCNQGLDPFLVAVMVQSEVQVALRHLVLILVIMASSSSPASGRFFSSAKCDGSFTSSGYRKVVARLLAGMR